MIWNRTHKPTAQIIPFPVDRARERRPVEEPEGGLGKILLYTGVRYERAEEPADWHNGNHRPPRRGGSRS